MCKLGFMLKCLCLVQSYLKDFMYWPWPVFGENNLKCSRQFRIDFQFSQGSYTSTKTKFKVISRLFPGSKKNFPGRSR